MTEISDEMVEAYRQAAIRCSASTYSAPYHDACCARAGLEAVYPLMRAQIAAEVRAEVARSLSVPALHALRSIPDGEIRHGCVVMDGAQVRERFRQAYLAIENTEATDG